MTADLPSETESPSPIRHVTFSDSEHIMILFGMQGSSYIEVRRHENREVVDFRQYAPDVSIFIAMDRRLREYSPVSKRPVVPRMTVTWASGQVLEMNVKDLPDETRILMMGLMRQMTVTTPLFSPYQPHAHPITWLGCVLFGLCVSLLSWSIFGLSLWFFMGVLVGGGGLALLLYLDAKRSVEVIALLSDEANSPNKLPSSSLYLDDDE